MTQRCSIRAIAVAAKVSVATVSRALKGLGTVAPETKERIQKLASEMGYEKDTQLAQVFSMMRERRRSVYKETLAFLTDAPEQAQDPLDWMGKFYEGACAWADKNGYKLEIEHLTKTAKEQRFLSRVLIARGVRGLIVAPVTRWRTPRLFFDWKQFAAVEIANTVWSPKFHRVESDTSHGNTLLEALRLLKKRGYRRIGMAMHANDLRRRRWGPLATYLLFQHLCPGLPRLAPFDHSRGFAPYFVGFEEWLAKEKPDVIVTAGPSVQEKLVSMSVKVPEEIGILLIDCSPQNQCSGLAPDYHGIGETAVRMVTRMLDYGEMGLPSFPKVLQQPAIWQDGKTLRS